LTNVLRLQHLPRDAAAEASATLAMLDEHLALAPAIARARADGDPAPSRKHCAHAPSRRVATKDGSRRSMR
jgi:hypothetical protein